MSFVYKRALALSVALGLALPMASLAGAQSGVASPSHTMSGLPDAPTRHAAWFEMKIAPDKTAPPLSVSDKIESGIRDSVYPPSPFAWFASAGWDHLVDGSPNYGSDKGAFGERLGASAIRDISETVFIKSFFEPVLHEDPRYYQLGRGHSIVGRGVYSATRVFVTRKDDGRTTPYYALFAGDVSGIALAATYYPPRDTTFGKAVESFAGSLGGTALNFLVEEFLDDGLRAAHLKKAE